MITLQNITLRRGSKLLFDQTSATIYAKQKVGLVGANGSGKSSLFSLLLQQTNVDGGDLYIQTKIRVAHLAQEIPNTEVSALQYVMDGDPEISILIQQQQKAERDHDGILSTKLHNRLYELGGYTLESRAAKILVGLGFKLEDHQKAVNFFSGGWQMRLNLAQVLMSNADLLLLDEPTNYLDMDAIVWLERWLQNFDGTLLLISHDRDFLDNVVQRIIYINNSKLESYSGNYSSFERQKAERLAQEQSLHEKQQAKIEHLTKYINRFRAKASKARQAQSRIKMLERMEEVVITRNNSSFSFKFFQPQPSGAPLLRLDNVDISYGEHQVLNKVNFSISPGDSVGVLGINGAGKSTFMKTLAGILKPSNGEIVFNKAIKISYFSQQQIDRLDMQVSPIEHFLNFYPDVREQEARSFLGGFGFRKDTIFHPIINFSGGEKARLVLSFLIWQKPNLLLLDEPTNHLDLEMRETLTYALQDYTGALVLIAHDRHFLKATVEELYLVNDHKVAKFDGDLDDYQKWLLDERKQSNADFTAKKPVVKKVSVHKENQQTKKFEDEIKKLHAEQDQLALLLSDPKIYQRDNRQELEKLLREALL
jgi:ATP-binding cassette subfamily F protein 3